MSPFLHGNPVPPERFIGRRLERDRLIGLIADNGQSAGIIGETRMGRTSLLKLLASPAVQAEMAQRTPVRLLFRRIDAASLADGFDRAGFWAHVFAPLADDGLLGTAGDRLLTRYQASLAKGFEAGPLELLMERLAETDRRLVLLIDELDELLEQHVKGHPGFFAGLRSLSQHGALTLIFTSRRPLAALNQVASTVSGPGSPFFNTFHEILLGPLEAAEVDDILNAAGDRFSLEDRAFVHAAAGGQPYLAQAAADALWRAYGAGHGGDAARKEAASTLARITDLTLRNTWQRWPAKTRHAAAAIGAAHLEAMGEAAGWASSEGIAVASLAEDTDFLRHEIDTLQRHGFAERRGGYRIRPIAFLAWLTTLLREKSRSPQAWARWIDEEEWDGVLSPARRDTWKQSLRRCALTVRTDLETLLAANAALADAPRSLRRPLPQPLPHDRSPRPVLVVHSHANADEPHRRRLEAHLSARKHEGLLETWAPGDLTTGTDWRAEIDAKLDRADIIVLFLSADFLGSDQCFKVELRQAREIHESGRALVIPLRVRAVDLGELWLTELVPLPANGAPIADRGDEAWADVAARIGEAALEISARRA